MKVNGLNKEIILVLLLNRSFHLNIMDKCISVLLNAIYSCSRQSSDNWLRYVTSYGHNNGIIIRSNLMLFESADYQNIYSLDLLIIKYQLMSMVFKSHFLTHRSLDLIVFVDLLAKSCCHSHS